MSSAKEAITNLEGDLYHLASYLRGARAIADAQLERGARSIEIEDVQAIANLMQAAINNLSNICDACARAGARIRNLDEPVTS